MKKRLNNLGLFLSLLGIFLIVIQPIRQLTGAIIASSLNSPNISFFIGLLLSIIGILIFESGRDERLEDIAEDESQRLGIHDTSEQVELTQAQQEYINKHTPDHLKNYKPTWLYNAFRFLGKMRLKSVEGKEGLPKGPKLYIINHREISGELESLFASLDEPVHVFAGETMVWKYMPWVAKKLGTIPIKETFSNLDYQEKQEAIRQTLPHVRPLFRDIIDKENKGAIRNRNYIKQMTSMLLQGKSGGVFTEGPSLEMSRKLKRSYAGGFTLPAREYERQTGKKLPIVPVGIYRGKVAFGKHFYVDENGRQSREELEQVATEKINRLYNRLNS